MNEARIAERLAGKLMFDRHSIENAIRDNMSGRPLITTEETMYSSLLVRFPNLTKDQFGRVWWNLIDEGYLIRKSHKGYSWEDWR